MWIDISLIYLFTFKYFYSSLTILYYFLVLDRYRRRLQTVDFLTRQGMELPPDSERSYHRCLGPSSYRSPNSYTPPPSAIPRPAFNPRQYPPVHNHLDRRQTIDLYPPTRYDHNSVHSYRPEPRYPHSPNSSHSEMAGYRQQQDSWREGRSERRDFPERETRYSRTTSRTRSSSYTSRNSQSSRSRSKSHSNEGRESSSVRRKTSDRPGAKDDAKDDRVYKQSGPAVVRRKSPSPWAWSNPEPPSTAKIKRLKSLVQVALRRKPSPPLFPRSDPQQQPVHARIGKYLVDRQLARTPVRAAAVRARARTPVRSGYSNHFSTAWSSSAKPPSVRSVVFRAPVLASTSPRRVESLVVRPRRAPSLVRASAMKAVARACSILNRRNSVARQSIAPNVSPTFFFLLLKCLVFV